MEPYREGFLLHNQPPFLCFVCNKAVSGLAFVVHHRDGNHSNNEPANWVAAHKRCHDAHHRATPPVELEGPLLQPPLSGVPYKRNSGRVGLYAKELARALREEPWALEQPGLLSKYPWLKLVSKAEVRCVGPGPVPQGAVR